MAMVKAYTEESAHNLNSHGNSCMYVNENSITKTTKGENDGLNTAESIRGINVAFILLFLPLSARWYT